MQSCTIELLYVERHSSMSIFPGKSHKYLNFIIVKNSMNLMVFQNRKVINTFNKNYYKIQQSMNFFCIAVPTICMFLQYNVLILKN